MFQMSWVRGAVLAAALTGTGAAAGGPGDFQLIHFTEDGTENSESLFPDFDHDSVWGGMGQASNGQIYIAVSNHDEVEGNVAIYRLDPKTDQMHLLGDLESVSREVGNYLPEESQYKVHGFMQEHSDGLIYFATMPTGAFDAPRGSHLYTLDPKTDVIKDISLDMEMIFNRDLEVVPNGPAGPDGGVIVAGQGIKGFGLNPAYPGVVYGMTWGYGNLVRIDLNGKDHAVIGTSRANSYVFHVDDEGDVYYFGGDEEETQDLLRYDAATGETQVLEADLPFDEIGMMTKALSGPVLAVMFSKSKQVKLVDTEREQVFPGHRVCGKNWWKLFNLTPSQDGKFGYVLSNNNNHSKVWRRAYAGGGCQLVHDIDELLGTRNLSFPGKNIRYGEYVYAPVWTHDGEPSDLAIVKFWAP